MHAAKYALDKLFLFMLCVGIAVFLLDFTALISPEAIFAVHTVNLAILLGYFCFFARDFVRAKNKAIYCKEHWLLALLLILPFFPFARLFRFAPIREAVSLSQNIAWYLFDEAGML